MSDVAPAAALSPADPAAGPPPGWYADPMDAAQRRWWSGIGWTEHVEVAEPEVVNDPGEPEIVIPQRSAVRSASSEQAVVDALAARSGTKDPYRDREVISKFALVFALVSVVGVAARLVVEVPLLLQFVFGGAPISVAGIAIYIAFRSGASMRIPILAGVISVATAAASSALDAASFSGMMSGLI